MKRKECQQIMSWIVDKKISSCEECPELEACNDWGEMQREESMRAHEKFIRSDQSGASGREGGATK